MTNLLLISGRAHFLLWTLLLLPCLTMPALGQTIQGKVTDAGNGDALPGVAIKVKGTSYGTITDVAGAYQLELDEYPKAKLIFTFLGMKTQEVVVGTQSRVDVQLVSDSQELDEVVVMGYSAESKRMLTTSTQVVKSDKLEDLAVGSLDAALSGQAAGVQVTQNSGTPGSALSVRVRGVGSVNAGNQPLYVIDGIPVTSENGSQVSFSGQTISALSDLNPSDIESITMLKDGAGAAIYGARAANGVVLITTKRGKNGKDVINFNAYYGIQQAWKQLDLLNKEQWFEYKNDQLGFEKYSPEYIANYEHDTDWQSEIFQVAPQANYDLSAQGGNERTSYFLSGSYFRQDGIVKGSAYERMSLRLNLDHMLSEKLKVGSSLQFTYSDTDRIEGDQSLNAPLPNALSLPAIYPVRNEDGSFNEDGPYANPVAIAENAVNKAYSYRGLGNVYLDYEIISNLNFQLKGGFDYYQLREHSYDPVTTRQGATYNGLGFNANSQSLNATVNATLRYNKQWADVHRLDVLLGWSAEQYQRRTNFLRGQNFSRPEFEYITSASEIVAADSYGLDRGINSYFSKVNYGYADRYLFTASVRRDGSSKFGNDNRYGLFPAASFAWRAIEESFLQGRKNLSNLKLRVGYGLTGNDAIGDFRYQALFSSGSDYFGQPGIRPSQLPNESLQWETVIQTNVGLDMGWWNDRLSGSFDYYIKTTEDMLLSRPLPLSSGYSSVMSNVGSMQNKGWELQLSYDVLAQSKSVYWNTSLNLASNKNEVLKLYNGQPIDNIGRGSNRIQEGSPISVFYGFEALGVDASTGDMVFADLNQDGEITTEDRTVIGNPHPELFGGWNNQLRWKGFDVQLFFQFSYGNDIYNGTRVYLESMKGADNQMTTILDRWQQPGDITDIPRATANDPNNNNRTSSRFVEDGSFLRLKNLTVGYSLPQPVLEKLHLRKCRFYVSGQNLWTLTNYSGLDPEVNYAGDDDVRLGTDFFTYPNPRVFVAGVNLTL
ncbi:TonB-dependent receptor [Persicobacter sp. CCB-QB2]|uniref:SusC/RagA family TonB-linked outer membrane protein n=1 Tax=Persicobacter sp. CCB-QB2 TaxID=1561025 RepID=UPI0009E304BF|nr:TonB-dependent receptor [Persicobacter sp. CCB-QB2]